MIKTKLLILISSFLLSNSFCRGDDSYVLRWASSGGGWRSMVANMGYVNAFRQADLISTDKTNFTAISSTSGGSWFNLQLGYSQEFFNNVVESSPTSLQAFVVDWMTSYQDFQTNATTPHAGCEELLGMNVLPRLAPVLELCNEFASFNLSWANFVQGMLNATSYNYGDRSFSTRDANSANRVKALQGTDIFIQTSLAPNSRVLNTGDGSSKMAYLGPPDTEEVYTVPLAMQYAVKDTYSMYYTATETPMLDAKPATAPETFDREDWTDFYLYPSTEGTVLTQPQATPQTYGNSFFQEPFSGRPTVSQIASASSAAAATMSGAVPSALAQYESTLAAQVSATTLPPVIKQFVEERSLSKVFDYIYNTGLLDDLAVCSQWPLECGESDGRLLDGGFTDGPTMAQNIGQYQTIDNGDLDKTLKMIVTNNNYYSDSNAKFLSYFSTSFNEDVSPGDFVWAPGTGSGQIAQQTPWRSMQIFQESMDSAALEDAFVEISGTNLTTAVYKATTIDNPAFGVKEGQKVEILLLQINSNIPTFIVGSSVTEAMTEPLAELAEQIAGSKQLVGRINEFLGNKETPSRLQNRFSRGHQLRRRVRSIN